MPTVREIEQAQFDLAPKDGAMVWDNVGQLLGDPEQAVEKVLVALDITEAVADEAIETGCQLIVAHHPVMEVKAGQMELTLGQLHGGAKLLADPLGERYIIEKIIRMQGAVVGLSRSAAPEKADEIRDTITALMELREEWRHANCP